MLLNEFAHMANLMEFDERFQALKLQRDNSNQLIEVCFPNSTASSTLPGTMVTV